jgi:hypothetical protein
MEKAIALADRGRGVQLPMSRITIGEVVPYFQSDCSYDEIARWLPSLNHEKIAIFDRYYREHKEELDQHERAVFDHRAEQIQLLKLRFPEKQGSHRARLAQLKRLLKRRRGETNGEGHQEGEPGVSSVSR